MKELWAWATFQAHRFGDWCAEQVTIQRLFGLLVIVMVIYLLNQSAGSSRRN